MSRMSHTACYPAVERDDPRFDGQFVTAVLTTGIFCRSVCKAQTPRPENVRFFSTAAAAAEAGFRPCLRCRPESAPDPPLWQSVSPVVSRALQYIGEGLLNEHGVEELARRLNVSARHLQRLFLDELGTPPVSVAQTRRLLFAKKLIDETNLSMADVAFSAGYSSVRRFNEAIRQTYGRTPTEIRRKRRGSIASQAESTVELRLFYREPYNWPAMLEFLKRHATPFVEQVDGRTYRRAIQVGEHSGVIEVEPVTGLNAVRLRVPIDISRHLLPISERVKQVFDLRADPIAIDTHLGEHPVLRETVQAHSGVRVPGAWDIHELAVRSLLDRHFGVERARLAMGLIVQTFSEEMTGRNGSAVTHLFPSPERLSQAPADEFKLPEYLVGMIRALSSQFHIEPDALTDSGNSETISARLSSVPVFDEQMIHYVRMRALSLPDVDVAGYLSREARADRNGVSLSNDQREARRPWRSYAAMYEWYATSVASNQNDAFTLQGATAP